MPCGGPARSPFLTCLDQFGSRRLAHVPERLLGWSVATTMTSHLVVDAATQEIWTRGREGKDLAGLILDVRGCDLSSQRGAPLAEADEGRGAQTAAFACHLSVQ